MDFKSYLLDNRFSLLDLICITFLTTTLVTDQQHLTVAFLGGALLAALGYYIYRVVQARREANWKRRQWQALATPGTKINAIKLYRELYGSGLKEAVEAVNEYIDRK